jgi:pimeloyl-ACP methyl ester carboxylesterase
LWPQLAELLDHWGQQVRGDVVLIHGVAADAAVLEYLAVLAVLVGTSAGATIAVDLAVRRPDLVQAVITREAA